MLVTSIFSLTHNDLSWKIIFCGGPFDYGVRYKRLIEPLRHIPSKFNKQKTYRINNQTPPPPPPLPLQKKIIYPCLTFKRICIKERIYFCLEFQISCSNWHKFSHTSIPTVRSQDVNPFPHKAAF